MKKSHKTLLYFGGVAIQLGVFSLYTRTDFLVTLANQVWSYF
jgi:hypothetical protein